MENYSVRDHLNSIGEVPEWVATLGESIQEIMGYDAALAASLARDLSAHPGLSKGLESFVTGWLSLKKVSKVSRLTTWQKNSLVKLMSGMTSQVEELFKNT